MIQTPHNKFCILPWVSLEIGPIGTVRTCCLSEEEILDDDGQKFDLSSSSFLNIQNSDYMRNVRQQFIDGEQPSACRKCWNEERAGRTSKRMHTLNRLKHMVNDSTWTTDAKPLMFLDLKLGNICNLKCRICGSWSSSTYAVEELNFISADEEKKKNYHYQMIKKGSWPQENTKFWSEINEIISQIRYIEFTGGEPFMIKEHFQLLQGIVDLGIAQDVEIHYNTNGTQWPVGAEEIWKHFKTVEIAFSIDDIGPRFEYQRSNAIWQEVKENIEKFRQLRERNSNIRLQVCSTVNIFNVMYLEELSLWSALQNFDFTYWNMLHDPYYYSIGTLPIEAKEIVENRLRSANVSVEDRKEFDNIIDFMSRGVSLDGKILRMSIRSHDWKRNQNLNDNHLELATAIGYDRTS
jgi:MoaA/NifB/PqqE/SkfB family radical SAM enzyme